jgi:hypothetical protein
VTWPATLTDIRNNIFKAKCDIKSSDDLQQCIQIARNRTFIIPQTESEYEDDQKKPKWNLNGEVIKIKTPF